VAQILLQDGLVMDEKMNAFAENQGYFHPFVDSENMAVLPFKRDHSEGKGLCYRPGYQENLDTVWRPSHAASRGLLESRY
jgi:hypothetical protein